MIDFYNGQITDILPFNIAQEPEVKAISYALRKGTQLLYGYAMRLYLWTNIDGQPEDVLDLMAAELRTQYYRQDLDIEAKRKLVKGTLAWYMTAGTPEAVEELVSAVFGEGKVYEWFEYGDKPYYFKIETNALLTPDILDEFYALIYRVKNTRSHLRSVEIKRTIKVGPKISPYTFSAPKLSITNNLAGQQPCVIFKKSSSAAAVSIPAITIANNPDKYKDVPILVSGGYGASATSHPNISTISGGTEKGRRIKIHAPIGRGASAMPHLIISRHPCILAKGSRGILLRAND